LRSYPDRRKCVWVRGHEQAMCMSASDIFYIHLTRDRLLLPSHLPTRVGRDPLHQPAASAEPPRARCLDLTPPFVFANIYMSNQALRCARCLTTGSVALGVSPSWLYLHLIPYPIPYTGTLPTNVLRFPSSHVCGDITLRLNSLWPPTTALHAPQEPLL
jgi:hypothetical protein